MVLKSKEFCIKIKTKENSSSADFFTVENLFSTKMFT